MKITSKADKIIIGIILVINILLIILRLQTGGFSSPRGNFLSAILFVCILFGLLYLFFSKKYDYFILLWLSFYFASPILALPFTTIGSLGILNAIFIPLMLYKSFDLKNKYLVIILSIFLVGVLNISSVEIQVIISRIFSFLAPFIFFYFVLKKCKNLELIMWGAIIIALINAPLGIYEFFSKPVWGSNADWRGTRIFGNLFGPNPYSFYLLSCILGLYAFFKKAKNKWIFAMMLILVIVDVFTFSRNGLVCLILAVAVFEFFYKTGFKITKRKMAILALLLLSLFAYIYISPNLDTHFTTETIKERTSIWESITPFIKGNLILGNGLGSYDIYRENFLYALSSHNYYLNIMFELGLIGLFLFLTFLFFIFLDLKAKLHAKSSFRSGELGLALLAGIIVFSFVGNAAFNQVVSLNAWIFLACCVKYNEKD